MGRKRMSALFLSAILSAAMLFGGCGDQADQQGASQESERIPGASQESGNIPEAKDPDNTDTDEMPMAAQGDTSAGSSDLSDTEMMPFTAEDVQVGLPMEVNLRLDCYGDNTCKLIVKMAQTDAELEVDQGTYRMSGAYQYTFNFEKAGELISGLDYATANAQGMGLTLAYKADVEVEFDGVITPLCIDSVLSGRVMNQSFAKEVEAIEAKYPANSRSGEIVFYGASNFRLWTEMENDLSDYKVQNHGFGGSTDELLVKYADRILYLYDPQIVVFQTGSNDYEHMDKTDDEIVKECIEYKRQMFADFHEKLPEAEFVVMSGILLPGRSDYTALTQDLNSELEKLCEEFDHMHFVDASDMTFDGQKYAEDLFTEDLIHLNHEGQLRWCEEYIRPALEQVVMEKELEGLKK